MCRERITHSKRGIAERNQALCLPYRKLESGREGKMLTDIIIQDRKTNKGQMKEVEI